MTKLNKEELIALAKESGLIDKNRLVLMKLGTGYRNDKAIIKFATLIESKLSDAKPVEQSDVSERELFEKNFSKESDLNLSRNCEGYIYITAQQAWLGWQASAKVNRGVSNENT